MFEFTRNFKITFKQSWITFEYTCKKFSDANKKAHGNKEA